MSPITHKIFNLNDFKKIVDGREALYVALSTDTYIGRSIIEYGEFSQAEFALIQQLITPGCFVAEVGANIGSHSVRIAKHIGTLGRLVAIEPQPVLFQCMAATMALNNITNVDCWPYALSSSRGKINLPEIDYNETRNFGSLSLIDIPEGKINIPQHRFDDIYLYDRLDLLKVDVEGMELDVLKGAANCIARFCPKIYIENDRRENSPALIKWLFNQDYRLWWHTPPLFNAGNYFENPKNYFKDIVSINMICVHKSISTNFDANEIIDINEFPEITDISNKK